MLIQEEQNILVVAAHPDDEVLGVGGLIFELVSSGFTVDCCILSGSVEARYKKPAQSTLENNMYLAKDILGYRHLKVGNFPNIAFNSVPHLHLVQFIEQCISEFNSQVIFTHHVRDLNNDHLHTAKACMAASRLWMRRDNVEPFTCLYLIDLP